MGSTLCKTTSAVAILIGALAVGAWRPPEAVAQFPGDESLPPGALARLGTTRWRLGGAVTFLAFLPGDAQLLTVGADGVCQVLDADGREVRRFGTAGQSWLHVALAPDGAMLATVSPDSKVVLWEVATGRKVQTIAATPAGWPGEVAFAGDGRSVLVADASAKGRVKQWDVATGKELRAFAEPPYVGPALADGRHFEASADGKVIATFGHQQDRFKVVVALWDPPTGQLRRTVAGIGNGRAFVSALALSPDGQRLAWATRDGHFRLHDLERDRPLADLAACLPAKQTVVDVAFARDGKALAARLGDGTVLLLDSVTGAARDVQFSAPRSHGGDALLAFRADGTVLAVASGPAVRLLDLTTGRPVPQEGHATGIAALSVAPDGRAVTTQDNGGTIRRWEVATGWPLPLSRLEEAAQGRIAPSAAGTLAAVLRGEDQVDVRSAPEGKVVSTIRLPALDQRDRLYMKKIDIWADALFTPDGNSLVTRGGDRQSLGVWRVADGTLERNVAVRRERLLKSVGSGEWIPGFGIGDVGLAPGGQVAVHFWGTYDHGGGLGNRVRRDEIVFLALATGTELRSLRLPPACTVRGMAVAPDGRVVVTPITGGPRDEAADRGRVPDKEIAVWEVATGQQRASLADPAHCLRFSPDGRLLATGNQTGVVRVWDLLSGRPVARWDAHRGAVHALAFTPDGKFLISAGADTTAIVWDVGAAVAKAPRDRRVLSARQLDSALDELGEDAAIACRAMEMLVAAAEQALPRLQDRLQPVPALDAARIQRWIGELSSNEFATRERAAKELEAHGDQALPALRQALQTGPDLETQRRLEQLLTAATGDSPPPATLRALRMLEVLEYLDGPAARQAAKRLAGGAPAARLTKEARAVLERLGQ